jgi:hypothetical protein
MSIQRTGGPRAARTQTVTTKPTTAPTRSESPKRPARSDSTSDSFSASPPRASANDSRNYTGGRFQLDLAGHNVGFTKNVKE